VRLSVGKRLGFGLATALVAVLGVELCSVVGLSLRRGSLLTYTGAMAEKAVVGAGTESDSEVLGYLERVQKAALAIKTQALHPYLGYVQDPAVAHGLADNVTEHGFLAATAPPAERDDAFVVGLFGGSVANILAMTAAPELVAELERSPEVAGRQVWVRSFAMGGYKQPQQTIALTWLLARGDRLDVAVNLDGFNEVALPVARLLPARTYPFYPFSWPLRASGVLDPDDQSVIGEIGFLGRRRAEVARRFSAPVVRLSPTAHLLWRMWDRGLERRMVALRQQVPNMTRDQRSFQVNGPQYTSTSLEEDLRSCAQLWGRCSQQMHSLCEPMNIRYYHFLQPNQYVPGTKPMGPAERARAFDPEHEYLQCAEEGYPVLLEVGRDLADNGVRFHDLSRLFEDVAEPVYNDTCCHFTELGNRMLAGEIGRRIVADLGTR
jgi:hypothetical protein